MSQPQTQPDAAGPPPRCLGDFELVREIGRGGMGVVYEARQRSLNRRVALKVLDGKFGLTPRAVERFRREAEAAAQLHHTNIVPVYATGEQDGVHFYAMELIEGPSLDRVIRQLRQTRQDVAAPAEDATPTGSPLPSDLETTGPYQGSPPPALSSGASSSGLNSSSAYFDTVARMIADVADALEHAHKQGVIHRDVKPANLLLAPDGRLSVNDFGLARILEQPGVTMTGECVGTPAYMSPEQIAAGRIPLDHRTDIYSLGATLYELLTFQPPFPGVRRDQVLAQIIQKEARPPRRLNRKVPVDLETICLKALDKDPDRRYQSARAMAEDLRRFLNRFAIVAKRAGPLQRLGKLVRRHPALAGALACALVAVVAAGFFAYQAHAARQQELAGKRQNAFEKAYLCAMGGDFDAAEEALAEAERLGAATGQVRLLRGHIAVYSGKNEEALRHFEQAAVLLPDSVAARAGLAMAYGSAGQWDQCEETMHQVNRMVPVTPDDYLFKGYAESWNDPAQGLKTLDEAVRRRPSVVARMVRADICWSLAQDRNSAAEAEQAAQDADTVRQLLPDNPAPLWIGVCANLVAANASGDKPQREAALARARTNAQALERFRHVPEALQTRWIFFRAVDEEATVAAELRQGAAKSSNPEVAYPCCMVLYRFRKDAEAAAVLEKHHGNSKCDCVRCFVLADLPGGVARARSLCTELEGRDLRGWDVLNCQLARCYLGDGAAAAEASKRHLNHPERFTLFRRDSFRSSLEYLAGHLSQSELEKSSVDTQGDRCSACFTIGIKLLGEGKRAEAKSYFQKCFDMQVFTCIPYDMSRVLLERLKDPAWPPWIPGPK